MNTPQTVGVKEFRENFKKYANATKRGQSFIVSNHKEPLFKVGPLEEPVGKYTLKDMTKIRFSHPDKNVSKKIDEIVYGV